MPIPSRPLTVSPMNRRRFLFTATGLALAALSASAWSLAKGLTPLETPAPAPALRLQDLQGKTRGGGEEAPARHGVGGRGSGGDGHEGRAPE